MQRLRIFTRAGATDLSRVVNVFALLGLDPLLLMARPHGAGLEIEAYVQADDRGFQLCRERLRALACVAEAFFEAGQSAPDECAEQRRAVG